MWINAHLQRHPVIGHVPNNHSLSTNQPSRSTLHKIARKNFFQASNFGYILCVCWFGKFRLWSDEPHTETRRETQKPSETSLRSRRSVNRQSVSNWERRRMLGEKSTGLFKASNTADSNCLKATGRPDGWFIRPVMSWPCLTFPFVLLHRLSKLLLPFSFFLLKQTLAYQCTPPMCIVHSTDSLGGDTLM